MLRNAFFTLTVACELASDEGKADDQFDEMCAAIRLALVDAGIPYAYDQTWAMQDADTLPVKRGDAEGVS